MAFYGFRKKPPDPFTVWVVAAVIYAAAATALLWPLLLAIGSAVVQPIDDPLLTVWILWWHSHAVPFSAEWWNAPIFYPTTGTLAFSELLVGLAPLTAPVQWLTQNPVAAHNVAVILSFPLCAMAAHALALEITGRHDASILAGLAFGFAAIRGSEIAHIQMLSVYWAPVALLALHRYVRQRQARWLALFAAAFVLQVLCNGYTLFQLPILVALWTLWFARRRIEFVAIASALAAALVALAPLLLKYRAIHESLHLRRSIDEILQFSASIESLFSAPPNNLLLGNVLTARQSYGLFPGLTVLLLLVVATVVHVRRRAPPTASGGRERVVLAAVAIVAAAAGCITLLAGAWAIGPLTVSTPHKPLAIAILAATAFLLRGPRWRAVWRTRSALGFYAVAAVVFAVLALGPEPRLFGTPIFYKAPYSWLMQLPGYESIRAPDRFAMMAVLSIAMVIAVTYARWREARPAQSPWVFAALCAGLLLDGWCRVDVGAVPQRPAPEDWRGAVAIVELPLTTETGAPATFRSIWYGLPLLNGVSGYAPPHYAALEAALADGDASVLLEFATRGPIGVVVDRASPEHARWVTSLSALPGTTRLSESTERTTFLVPAATRPRPRVGNVEPIAGVQANAHPEEAHHLIDGRVDRIWSTAAQQGTEEILVTLDRPREIDALVLRLGACTFGFPRQLVVDVEDSAGWKEVFRGPTAVLAARAALAEPRDVPIVIHVGANTDRLRLRQTGTAAVPWCIAELTVHRPLR